MSTFRAREQGFTLVEVLVGMAILSVLGLGVWTGVTAGLRTAGKIHARALANARLLQLDDRFRDCAGRIRAPWWIAGPTVEAAGSAWSVSCLNGDPRKKLVVTLSDGALSIDDGDFVSRHPGVTSASLLAGIDGKDAALGMTLVVEGADFSRVSIVARYGSAPIQKQGGP